VSLVVDNLMKTFHREAFFGKGAPVIAVNRVSFTLAPGESLGIVGESGSGKTTLSKILAGFLSADAGTATLAGENLAALTRVERARRVQMVFQDPFGSINPKLLLGVQLKEALAPAAGDKDARAAALMKDVGLSPDQLRRYPHQISGGQRQRFAIARALAAEPRLLLADEPVSSLDLSVQAQILNLLNALRKARGFSQIVISHDLAVIANTCERVLVMKDGAVVESGPVDEVIGRAQHPYTRRLIAAAPTL
jgi:peptide/nickel transport system ATP-binding protein